MTSYLDNGYHVIKYFAKFEKFIPHSIIILSFMTIGSQLPELDRGAFCPPSYKIGSQNIPYKLGLRGVRCLLSENCEKIANFKVISFLIQNTTLVLGLGLASRVVYIERDRPSCCEFYAAIV